MSTTITFKVPTVREVKDTMHVAKQSMQDHLDRISYERKHKANMDRLLKELAITKNMLKQIRGNTTDDDVVRYIDSSSLDI